jgi:hypothetical protein
VDADPHTNSKLIANNILRDKKGICNMLSCNNILRVEYLLTSNTINMIQN